jgi:hypothetical protein
MAGEIQIAITDTGKILYAILRNRSGLVYRPATGLFETYNVANLSNYAITMTEQGNSRYYTGNAPAAVVDIDYSAVIYERVGASPAEGDPPVGMGSPRIDAYVITPALYFADIQFTRDQANTKDEYTISWFKNGQLLTAGVGSCIINVLNRTGTTLIASSAMTELSGTGMFVYDATGVARQTQGEAVIVNISATIDSATRAWSKVISRDSA